MPSFRARAAAPRTSSEKARPLGMIKPSTFSGPRARVARVAQTAESSPPESPTRACAHPQRSSSSRMKATRIFSTNAALIFRGTDDPFKGPPDRLGLLVALEQPFPAALPDIGHVDPADDELRVDRGPPGDEPAAGGEHERASGEGHTVLAADAVGVEDEGRGEIRDGLAHELP